MQRVQRVKTVVGNIEPGSYSHQIYLIWHSMITRCFSPNSKNYARYGGRGITVCERWLTFANFFEDMSEAPRGYSLDRINNDGSYCKENCRWASRAEQNRNRSNNVWLTINGVSKVSADWARELGLNPAAMNNRIKSGWSIERAITEQKPDRPNSKLSDDEVKQVLGLYPQLTYQEIADRFNVSKKTVLNIINGRIFKDIAAERSYVRPPVPKRLRKGTGVKFLTFNGETLHYGEWERRLGLTRGVIESRIRKGFSVEQALSTGRLKRRREGAWKLTDDQVREIRIANQEGVSGYALAKKYGVDKSVIYEIIKGKTYTHVV